MKKKFIGRFVQMCMLIAVVCGMAAAEPTDFYVSPNGSDKWSGKLPSPNASRTDGPFATIEKARDTIRRLGAGQAKRSQPWVVFVREGVYPLKNTLTFTPRDSGSKQVPVIYSAYPGEHPVISGGREIEGWKKLTEDMSGITSEAKGNLWVARIPKGWLFHSMYVNGEVQQRAVSPNGDDWTKWPTLASIGTAAPGGQPLTLPQGALDNIPGNGDVEMNFIASPWNNEMSVLRDVDPVSNTAKRHSKKFTYAYKGLGYAQGHYRIENALPALDQPGEWCVDSQHGMVYYWPKSDTMDGVDVIAPSLYELVRFQGREESGPWVHHLELRGLTFTYADRLGEDKWPDDWSRRVLEYEGAALVMQGAEDCVVEGNRFTLVSGYAIALDHYAQRNRVAGNEICYTGSGGIRLVGYEPGTMDVNRFNTVSRNHIHHIGVGSYWHSMGITLYASNCNTISYNYIHDVPYIGIGIAGLATAYWNFIREHYPDTYGDLNASYQIRWNELPEEWHKNMLENKGTLDIYGVKPYLHDGNNVVEYNIVENYMKKMDDGGALYAFASAGTNIWRRNLVYNPQGTTQYNLLQTIYMDAEVDGAIITGNIICAPGSTMENNYPQSNTWVAGGGRLNDECTRPLNTWENNIFNGENIPQGQNVRMPYKGITTEYVTLLRDIAATVKKQGGWLGDATPVGL